MQIWVDADACPMDAKELMFRLAQRRKITVTLVANQQMSVPRSEYLKMVSVPVSQDAADAFIAQQVSRGDLVITSDLPLAGQVVAKGGVVLDSRGQTITDQNIGERLALRNLLDDLRGTGLETGGPAPYSPKDRQEFVNSLDRLVTQLSRL